MPYATDGHDVPARIKGSKKRRQWAHVWNSTYESTGDEGRAFAAANSVYNNAKKVILIEDLADSTSFQELLDKLVSDPLEEFDFEADENYYEE